MIHLYRIFALSLVAFGGCLGSASIASSHQDVRISRVTFDGKGAFHWAKRGTLVAMSFGAHPRREKFSYVYLGRDNRLIVLTDNVPESSTMIAEQLDSRAEAEAMLREGLCGAALSFFGESNDYQVTEVYIENRRELPSGRFDEPRPLKAAIEESLIRLQRYAKPAEPLIEGNNWTLQFYVTSLDGRVDRWEMDGAVFPFSIRHLKRITVEKAGTIVPMSPAPG